MFSAKMRSSTRLTTRSLASWSNLLGIFEIFPSTQTEQNLGHFSYPVITVIANIPDHRPDLVQRNFRDQALRRLWVAEITYVRTLSGFAYTAFVTDVYSRKIIGVATRSTMRIDTLPMEALELALTAAGRIRDGPAGAPQ